MQIDESRILAAIGGLEVSAQAREDGSELIDTWANTCLEYDAAHQTLAVEAGFYIELDPQTFVVGVIDRLAQDGEGVFACEWKTTKHQTKTWGPEEWFAEIERGHQLSTYALGLQAGTFIDGINFERPSECRVYVRAVSKSRPPVIWYAPENKSVVVSEARLNATRAAYTNAARSIRAMNGGGGVPWQLPGYHCTKFIKYRCPFWDTCHEYRQPKQGALGLSAQQLSPGSLKVVEHLKQVGKIRVDNQGQVLVLSSSTLDVWNQCPERWRQMVVTGELEEKNDNLQIGNVFHTGAAEIYRMMMEQATGT